MPTAVLMPKLGLTMTSGTVGLWVAEEGQPVAAGEIIVEVVTEKITYQVEAQVEGVLLKILVDEGEEVPVGTTIGVIGEPGDDLSAFLAGGPSADSLAATDVSPAADGTASDLAPAPPRAGAVGDRGTGRIPVSPAARKLAAELGIDPGSVAGSGPGGRVTTDDVRAAAETAAYGGASIPPGPRAGAESGAGPTAAPDSSAREVLREIPYAGVRRAIGEHMSLSRHTSPTVTHHTRADVEDLVRLLRGHNEGRPESERVSLTAALVKASAAAIAAEPSINATLTDDVIKVWRSIDIGVAVAVDDGLIVPVIRGADARSLDEVARELTGLSAKAREGALLFDEVGGTFTITNVGSFRSVDWFTPIINQPEAAILGVGRIVEEVVARHGAPVVRRTLGLSLTFDHRIIDGAPAAAFLRILLDHLEEPDRLFG